jgi:two-component system nitrogen regulation response regulator GlnG
VRRVLVIDDDRSIQRLVSGALQDTDWEIFSAVTQEEALAHLRNSPPDAVLLDLLLPEVHGIDLFRKIRDFDARLPVVFITAHGDSDSAIEAIKGGAYDYLTKPLSVDTVRNCLDRAWQMRRLMTTPVEVPTLSEVSVDSDAIVGRSSQMLEVYKAIGRVAEQDVAVLVLGESGTGKELIARAIYQHSRRAKGPFLAVNCGAIHETLLESELFGHEKGSFTGADQRRIGKFEHCSGGSIFLDEVGDMSPVVQVKLLRVLQQQQFERVGGNTTITVDTRVIAATNRDLDEQVASGQFREDLLYRLNGFTIRIPPLREREGDVPLLVEHAIARYAPSMGKSVVGISSSAMDILEAYHWPGNVRELHSIVRQAILQTTGPIIMPEFLPAEVTGLRSTRSGEYRDKGADEGADFTRFVRQRLEAGSTSLYAEGIERLERQLLPAVLEHTNGNQSVAARILGITRGSLRNKLRALGITVSQVVSTADEDGE